MHKLKEEILQLNRRLQVFTSQGERQTTEINKLRKFVSSLEFKLQVMTCTKDWLESELESVSRQHIGMTISKKKVDQKLVEMKEETSDTKQFKSEIVENKSGDSWVLDESSDKENQESRAKKFSRLASQKAILARHRRKTSSLALAAKQG